MTDNRSIAGRGRAERRKAIRAKAIADGLHTYDLQEPCVKGHMSFRYTSDTTCVECAAEKQRNKNVRKGLPFERTCAKELGLKFYNTGRPCKHGHFCDRQTINGACLECLKSRSVARAFQKRLYMRAKRAGMSEEEKLVKRARAAAYNRKEREDHPDRVRERDRKNGRLKRQRHPQRKLAEVRLRQISLMKRTPPWADKKAISSFYQNCPIGMEVDHIIPLRGADVSGLHVIENLQYLTSKQNRAKSNSFLRDTVESVDYLKLKLKGLAR